MSKDSSFRAVKDAVEGESFYDTVDVGVSTPNGQVIIYRDVHLAVSYNYGYMQMDVDVMWEEDKLQKPYQSLGLHGKYNTNFQEFTFNGGYLSWQDGENTISIRL